MVINLNNISLNFRNLICNVYDISDFTSECVIGIK
jgi:hypothetical protein